MNNKKNSAGGILIGLLLIVVGIILLWFNEGRTVKTSQTISEAEDQYIDVDSETIDNTNEGKLVATTGKLQIPAEGVTDDYFGVTVTGAKLSRTVEMYQYEESCKTDDNGNEHCTYNAVWDDSLIDSNAFENTSYHNPSSMPYSSETFLAQNAKVGAFNLDDVLLDQLNASQNVTLTETAKVQQMRLHVSGDYYTNVINNTPKIGDIRISFQYNNASNVSVLAIQTNGGFSKFVSSSNYEIYELQEGTHNGKEMLSTLTSENNTTKWILRLMGTVLVIFGFVVLISPLQRLANFIPIFGTIFGWVSGFITFVLGLGISLIVIALAWLRYRPVFSILLLVGVIAVFILMKKLKQGKSPKLETTTNTQNSSVNISYPNSQNVNTQNNTVYPNNDINQNNNQSF